MEIRLSGHSAYHTEYHIVWVFKYRRRILNPGLRGYLRKLLPKIIRSLPGCEIIEYNTQIDHIHMVMIIPPKYKVSEAISRIKSQTTSRLRKNFPAYPRYIGKRILFGHQDTLSLLYAWTKRAY